MSLRFTLWRIGNPVSWLTNSRISSTERKRALASALVIGRSDSIAGGCGVGAGGCDWAGGGDWAPAQATSSRRRKTDRRKAFMREASEYMTERESPPLTPCQQEKVATANRAC